MIAVDTHILIYAHRQDSPLHAAAANRMRELAQGLLAWALPWPCVQEFLSIATHPRIYMPPSLPEHARAQVTAWLHAPSVVLLAETPGYWQVLETLLSASAVAGPRVHDARIAALCLHHGVSELWSVDRDFSRFPALTVRNPLRS